MKEFIFTSLEISFSIAVFQALLIAFFLFIQKKGSTENRIILASILLNFIIFLTGSYLLLFKGNWKHIYYAHLANLTIFLTPALLYLYYNLLLDKTFHFKFYHLVHCLPFIAIFYTMFHIRNHVFSHGFVFTPYGTVLLILLFIQSVFYLWAIRKYKNNTAAQSIKNSKSKWFGYIFDSIIIIFCLKLLIMVLWNLFGFVELCIFFTGVFFILSFIIINTMIIYGLINPEILVQYFKYDSSTIDEHQKIKYFNEIQELLTHNKIYLDPLFSLSRLSKKINIPEKQLSQVINECAGKNYNDYINHYRITEAMKLIEQNQNINMLTIAYETGFNSKSTFNAAFKKFTHQTPTEYRRTIQNS